MQRRAREGLQVRQHRDRNLNNAQGRPWAPLVAQLVKNLPAMQETLVQFLGWEDPLEKGKGYPLHYSWASLVAQLVKYLPAMWETWV